MLLFHGSIVPYVQLLLSMVDKCHYIVQRMPLLLPVFENKVNVMFNIYFGIGCMAGWGDDYFGEGLVWGRVCGVMTWKMVELGENE